MANATPSVLNPFAKAYTNDGFVDTVIPKRNDDSRHQANGLILKKTEQECYCCRFHFEWSCTPTAIYCQMQIF
jgi:hypothetical protein